MSFSPNLNLKLINITVVGKSTVLTQKPAIYIGELLVTTKLLILNMYLQTINIFKL